MSGERETEGPDADLSAMRPEPRPVTAFEVVRLLFAQPALGLFLAATTRKWVLPLLLMVLILGAGSCFKSIGEYRYYAKTAHAVASGVSGDLAPVRFSRDGHLEWKGKEEGPYSKVIEGWRVSAGNLALSQYHGNTPEAADFRKSVEENRSLPAANGVTLLADGIVFWRHDGQEVIRTDVLKPLHLRRMAASRPQPDEALDAEALVTLTDLVCMGCVPVLACLFFAYFLGSAFFCALVFGLSSVVFRRGFLRRFGDGFVIGVNAAMPASLIAVIWYWASGWDFQTIFYMAFIAYLILAFFSSRGLSVTVERVEKNDR